MGATFKRAKRTLTVAVAGIGKVTGTGIDCGADCAQDYDYGTWATLTAAPGEGQDFERWGGACAGTATATVCRLEMKEARSATARFKPQKRTLTVAVAGIGKVTGTGIDCGADCAQDYDYGTAATLTAAPGEGQDFERWEGACAGTATGTVCRLEMKEARSATARFRPQKRTLAVTKTAGGSVSSAPAGISCGADCAQDYDYGTAVELTAAAESGYDFASWGGDCSASASSTCELTMDEARTASASFAAECAAATVAHCALDRADSGTMASGACTAGYNGSCSYACNDGVWSRSGNTCVPNPQCGDPSSAASACKPGAYGEAPGDRGVWAACSSQTSCEAGTPGWSTTRVDGKCGTAASPCAAGTENNRVVGTEETTWRCAGVDGQRTLTCTGTAGAWNWSCTNGTVTRSDCTREFGKNSASCGGLADPATDDDGCRECNAGYEECGGACVAKCGANSTRNSACGCDCDTGYRADGGVCKKLYTLTVTKTAGGDVSSSPAGIDCGTDCAEKYVDGTTAKLTAAPDANRKLSAWSGACSASASTTCAVLLDGDKTVGAAFVWEKRKLTVARPGNGHVAASGISCGSGGRTDCTEEYDHGTEVTLTATEDRGYDFASWGGACSASAASSTCRLTMEEARTASASFAAECAAATVAHCALDRADSGATVSGACASGHNGSCRYACGNGVWSRSVNTCVPNPQCGDPSSVASACKPGTRSEPPDDLGIWAVCSSPTSCEAGAPGWSTTRVDGKCGTAASPCAAGTENNRVVGTKETTWRCAGVDGQRTLTCFGTAGAWNWSCTNGTVTRSDCTLGFKENSASCGGLADPATDDNGCRECNAGYEVCSGACVANCGDNSTRNSTTCGCDCNRGYEACGGACVANCGDNSTRNLTNCGCDCNPGYRADGGVCKKLYTLTVEKTAGGSVSSSPAGIACGTDCAEMYVDGKMVTLTATAGTGHSFEKWEGDCTGTSPNCTLAMTAARSAKAKFKPQKRALSVTVVGTGTVTGTGVDCGTDCAEQYDYGTSVTLTATPGTGHSFEKWEGDCTGTSPNCTLAMTAARSAKAKFKPQKRALSVTVVGTGTVTGTGVDCGTDCAEQYDYGTSVTLTATPGTGHSFEKWEGDCTGTSPNCTLAMTAARSAKAKFKPQKRALSVTVVGTGTVTGTGVNCGTDCAEQYDYGTEVTLTATPGTGHSFEKWEGDCTGTSPNCTLAMTAARSAKAKFKPQKRALSVTVVGTGTVTGTGVNCGTDCTELYDYGTEVTLTASWISTHVLTWSGCDTKDQTALTCNVTMNADKTVAATYKLSCPAGCESATCGATEVCKCARACPQSYARHGNCMATQARTCTGDTDGCGRSVRYTRCTTGKDRPELANRPAETCQYEERDRSILGCAHRQRTCRATITHVGCVFSPGADEPGPIGFGDDEEWSEHAHGYILPTFECGAKANTCDVAFDDETVTTDDYGVAAKDDAGTEWRWECRSDNGTVRQCSLPKSGG